MDADYGDVRVAGRPLVDPVMPATDQVMRQETLADDGGHRVVGRRANPVQRLGLTKVAVISAVAVVIVGGGGVALAMSGGSDQDGSGTVRPQAVADAADTAKTQAVDPKVLEAERRRTALDRARRAARGEKRKAPVLAVKGTPLPSPSKEADGGAPTAGNPVPAGEAQRIAKNLLPSYGFNPDTQFGCLVKLWDRESGWRTTAANPSGAYGIPQALPGSKMASAGPNWQTNATTQIKWGLGYIKSRYKTPCGAWSAFLNQGWY